MQQESICIVSAQYLPHIGGVERYTDYLSRELTARGHKVTIITSEYPGYPVEEYVNGISVYRVPSWRLMDGRYPIIKNGKVLREMRGKLKREHISHILINTRFYPISLWAVRFAYQCHIPCTVIEHGTAHLQMGRFTFAAEWVEHILTSFLKRYHPYYMGVSKAACKWSEHFGIDNHLIAHNAIDNEEIEQYNFEDCNVIREKYHINNDDYFVLYAGRLIPEKGLVQLAEAVESIAGNGAIRLVLAGDGPLLDKLQADYGKAVQCIGSVEHDEILQLMHACDSFCLPSDSEGFPTVVLEAAACQAHVIATQYGGTKEILPNESYGICLADNNRDTIKNGLLCAMRDVKKRKEQAEKLHERVKQNYDWKQTADTVLEHVKECSKNAR